MPAGPPSSGPAGWLGARRQGTYITQLVLRIIADTSKWRGLGEDSVPYFRKNVVGIWRHYIQGGAAASKGPPSVCV